MRRWIFALIPVAALAGLIGWRLHTKQAEAASQAQMRKMRMTAAPAVSVAPAVMRDIVHTYEAVGNVEPPVNVKIASKVTARIEYLQVHEGDRVAQGQVLVRLDPSDLQANVAQQQANVAQAQQRLSQALLTQNPTNVSIQTGIEQQRAAVNSALANFNQTNQNYSKQVAAARAAVTDSQGKVDVAKAAVTNAEAGIRSAKANLANATAQMNRTQDLYKQGFVAAQDVDNAKTTVSVQQGAVDVANGQFGQAQAQLSSANAQKGSAQEQLDIVGTKGKADIEAARASLAQARAALAYAVANQAQKPAYQENIKALRSAVDAAQAALRNAQAQLAYTVLTSPIAGYVTSRTMDPGAMATPGTPMLAVQSMRQVWVNAPIPEEVSRKVFLRQPVTVAFDALPGETFSGPVTQINPAADPLSRQFTVRITLDNARDLIKPGMFARATFITDRVRSAVVVPAEAVQKGPTGPTIVVVDGDNVAHTVPVTTGASDAGGVAILEGIRPGQKVVIMSAMPVKDGQKVRIGGAGRPGGRGGRGQGGGPSGARPAGGGARGAM